jgi:Fe-S cluster assembly protein SufD
MPTDRDEDWRRTDLSFLDMTRLHTAPFDRAQVGRKVELPAWFKGAASHFEKSAGMLYQSTANGAVLELSVEAEKQGVIFCDIATAVEKHTDIIRPLMLDRPDDGTTKFTLLTRALFNCGAFLYIPRNVQLSEPMLICVDFSANTGPTFDAAQGAAMFPRILVVAEDNSKADVVFMVGSPSKDANATTVSLVSTLCDFHIKPGATFNYLEVQDFADDVLHIERVNSRVEKDASFNSLSIALGAKQTHADIATYLKAPGASSSVLGAVLGSNSEKFSYNTIQEHNAPDTTSNINFRVALKDNAASVYQGIIKVDKIAQRTAAYQSNKNLLLSADAKADSIPKLEILADDVKCSHGATVGPVDREQLFYLRSRGLTPVEAEELVVTGFYRQVLEQFPVASVVDWLMGVVSQKIYRAAANE